MAGKRIYLTDKEVASVLEISQSTLSRVVGGFVRGGTDRKTACIISRNLTDAKPESINGFRRWKVSALASVLGLTEEELLKRI